ncbi:MAG: hypothetical protein QGG29_03595 [Prochlorococcaceae cyanobacterium ETNP18_MAG_17]|jgi:hypothetical protein|nr:hypothetical protein [Prochlorococcaceae cyanobacterium ETNP18_MAG_17]
MTHLDGENGCCNWATSAAAKGSARVPLVHEKAPPSGGGDFLFSSFTAVHSFLQLQSKYCELDQG